MIAPARRAAYDALTAIASGKRDLPAALAIWRDALIDPRDRALTGEIVIGVLRWRAALDAIATRLAKRPLAKLDPEVLEILRIGIYQLWHLRRVPASAAVNDAVELTRVARRGRASALVNASLRALTRVDASTLLPARPIDAVADRQATLDYLATTLSHPRWYAARLLERHGFDAAERWLRFNNAPAPLTLRVNLRKTSLEAMEETLRAEGVTVERAAYAPGALLVRDGNAIASPHFASGDYIVQDEASQLVAQMAHAAPGERILDACASPGGKTFGMALDAAGRARLVAADVRSARVALLRDTLHRTMTPAAIVQLDLLRPAPFSAVFDCVLVDAPCSGLGTVRRDPDIKWRRDESELGRLAALQLQMLRNAAAAVRWGGRLVYATCSSEPEENDRVVDEFLREEPGFSPAAPDLTSAPSRNGLARVRDELGRLRTLPFEHGLEAFFAAVLVKNKGL